MVVVKLCLGKKRGAVEIFLESKLKLKISPNISISKCNVSLIKKRENLTCLWYRII